MRIPFPERVRISRVALFAAALAIIQRIEGTPFYLCAGCAVFILIAAFAFNAGGGLTRVSGAYVFFYSLLVVLVGICYKAFLGERADRNLIDPKTDIEVYIGGITAMYAAVVVSRRLARKSGLLQNVLKDAAMHRAAVGCVVFGTTATFLIPMLGSSATQVQSAFAQLNQLIPLGIIISVMYEIRRSGGTRSTTLFTVLVIAYFFFFYGALGFSKQGMLTPLLCWILPICALRFRLSIWQILSCLLGVFIIFHYLVPFAQYGRSQISEFPTLNERFTTATRLLEHPEQTRQTYNRLNSEIDQADRGLSAYYDTPQGFWERLQFISVDDQLNDATDRGSVFGLLPIEYEFANAIPHFIWPNKPGGNFGNEYAHDITGEARDEGDTTTGISFSPTGEAYHLARWTGVLVVAPLLWCMLFIVWDSLLGDLRTTPWGLLALALVSHTAPEGGIVGAIHLTTFGSEILIFCTLFAAWFAPIFAIPVLGPDRQRMEGSAPSVPAFTSRIPHRSPQ